MNKKERHFPLKKIFLNDNLHIRKKERDREKERKNMKEREGDREKKK